MTVCRGAQRARLSTLLLVPVMLLSAVSQASPQSEAARALIDSYIAGWREFWPSRAFAYGDAGSAGRFENFSEDRVASWLALNRNSFEEAQRLYEGSDAGDAGLPGSLRIDLQVLLGQAMEAQLEWRDAEPLASAPEWYAEKVSQALTHLLVREQLSERDRSAAAIARLRGVKQLCELGVATLTAGKRLRTERALRVLAGSRDFYRGSLLEITGSWPDADAISDAAAEAAEAITALQTHLEQKVLPYASDTVSIGAKRYSQALMRRSLGQYDPPRLLEAAAAEVKAARAAMVAEAERWKLSLGDDAPAAEGEALLTLAIEAMEADRDDNSADFLARFTELTFAAERFVEAHHIATVPKPTTLTVALSPAHFSGAAVGGVYPSGPFDPGADTLFYVPSIPDGAAPAAKEGFYRSFNTHFNTMIMSHEMLPGHYLQYKVAVTRASPVRALFGNGAYIEGWGTFAEELMLDAGWADNAPLTRLAHLRKRLENATRAYVSVQVSTGDWGEKEVLRFAREEGLLAPQFATNLWQRVVNTPLQITDYMTGYLHFKRLYARWRAAHPESEPRVWVDRVLQAGPLPMATLDWLLAQHDAPEAPASAH